MNIKHLQLSKIRSAIIALVALVFIASADYMTGNELLLSVFYLLPISLIALNLNKTVAIWTAVISGIIESTVHILYGGFYYSNILIHFWNMGIFIAVYIVIALLVSSLRDAYEREREIARKDFMTGIANWQAFVELAEREVARAKRFGTILSIVYIDCDNFKIVNDTLGHATGDMVLRKIASILQENLRQTDICARFGGDEFVILFTDLRSEGSEIAVKKIWSLLLEQMHKHGWYVTFSIGMATFIKPPESVETMIKKADMIMYEVKKNTQNAIKHEVFGG